MLAGILSVLLLGLALARVGGPTAGLIAAGAAGDQLRVGALHARRADGADDGRVPRRELLRVGARRAAAGVGPGRGRVRAARVLHEGLGGVLRRGSLGLVCLATLAETWRVRQRVVAFWVIPSARAAALTLAGLAVVRPRRRSRSSSLPNWQEYRFYNWQMSVTRKPTYSVKAVMDRVSWFPVVHDLFTRMWFSVVVGAIAAVGLAGAAAPGDRARAAAAARGWCSACLELVARDVGNERYLVYLIPAFVAVDGAGPRAGTAGCSPSGVGQWRTPPVARAAVRAGACPTWWRAPWCGWCSSTRSGPASGGRRSSPSSSTARSTRRGHGPPGCCRRRPLGAGAALALAALVMAGDLAQFAPVRGGPHLQELRGDAPGGRADPAGHARPRQAGQRPRAGKPDSPGLRGQPLRQLRRTGSAETMHDTS